MTEDLTDTATNVELDAGTAPAVESAPAVEDHGVEAAPVVASTPIVEDEEAGRHAADDGETRDAAVPSIPLPGGVELK